MAGTTGRFYLDPHDSVPEPNQPSTGGETHYMSFKLITKLKLITHLNIKQIFDTVLRNHILNIVTLRRKRDRQG